MTWHNDTLASGMGIATGTALGCSVRLVVTRPAALGTAQEAVGGVLDAIDHAASRFRPDSELSRLNATPGRDVAVSPLLATAIAAALRAAWVSRGAVDPTVASALRAAAYDLDWSLVEPEGDAIELEARPIPGWSGVRLDPARGTVRLPAGTEIDLGATAKALAADLAADAAQAAAGGGGALVSLGGDIAMRGQAPAGGWRIQIAEDSGDPLSEGAESISVTDGGVATSSTTVRRWRRGDEMLHHIIDPRTGRPATGPWRTATVFAGTCVDANIATTAAIVLGPEAIEWLEHISFPVRLVDQVGEVTRLNGWPAPSLETRPA